MRLHLKNRMRDEPTKTDIWIGLARAHHRALACIEKALKDAGLPPLGWYDVLLELERFGPGGARAYQLRDRLLLPQYRLSRLLQRIEKAGYLARQPCDADGRGHLLVITPAGQKMRKNIWAVYRVAIGQAIGGDLSPGEFNDLSRLLQKLK